MCSIPLEHLGGFVGLLVIFYRLCYQSIFHCILDDTVSIFANVVLHFSFLTFLWGKQFDSGFILAKEG